MSASLFVPGSHVKAREGDVLSLRSESGGLLPVCIRPEWMESLHICSRYELPSRIVIPVGVSCVVEFDRSVRASWSVAGEMGSQQGRIISLPAFGESALGVFVVDSQEREMVIAPFADGISDQSTNLLAPFRFNGGRCGLALKIEFGYAEKGSGHFFHGVGAKNAVTVNGVPNVPLLLNFGDSHLVSSNEAETDDDIVIASSPRMDSASIVSRLKAGVFPVDQPLSGAKRLWYGRDGLAYSGGPVRVRSAPAFGENWASCLGSPPPGFLPFEVPSAGDYCVMNIAAMHSWCCLTLEVDRKMTLAGRPRPTVVSELSKFNGSRWLPNLGISRVELSAGMNKSAQNGRQLCLIEPGIMDGAFRAGNQIVSFCREFASRFSRVGLVSFAGTMPEGLSVTNMDSLGANIDMAAANTSPGTAIAVFMAPDADDVAFASLRSVAAVHHRMIYALVLHADVAVVAEKFGINMLVPEDLSPVFSAQAGRQVVVFDSGTLIRTF